MTTGTLWGSRSVTRDGRRASDEGYTLIEMLVSAAIVVAVTAGIVAVLSPGQGASLTQPEVSDMQQRLRFAADAITSDLMMAGAGPYAGAPAGPLSGFMAAIVPRRTGPSSPDPAEIALSDRLSLMFVPPTSSQTTIRDPIPAGAASLVVDVRPGCPSGDASCGFETGMSILVFDDAGAFDTFTITGVHGSTLLVRSLGAASSAFKAGAHVAEVRKTTYWFDAANARVMKYDGDRTDLPVVENVVALRFEYYGEPLAPRIVTPLSDPVGPWATYGPRPPAIGVDNDGDIWGPGENCLFQADTVTGVHVPRLANLAAAPGALVPLPLAMMTDGPWCLDAVSPARYDADLLRIRQVRVTLRVQTANAALRGATGPLFARPGTARASGVVVPDLEVRFDVTPRNLNLER